MYIYIKIRFFGTTPYFTLPTIILLEIKKERGKCPQPEPINVQNVLFGRDVITNMATDRRRCTLFLSLVIFLLISQITAKSGLIELDEDNWHQMLEGEWMVEL